MRSTLITVAATLALCACGGNNDDQGATGDSALAVDSAAHRADTGSNHGAGMHGAVTGGDMSAQMSQMNATMVSELGAADSAYDLRFIDMMIPHHQGAVLMSEEALRKAVHPELRELAQKLINAQRKEIDYMTRLRSQWYGDSTTLMTETPHHMTEAMMEHLGPADSMYDARFIDMMIPHHQGAVMMADDALAKSTKPELKAMAEKIIADQKREITQLETWRERWYGR
jgi:uncharacterized protein (DUF305 family)